MVARDGVQRFRDPCFLAHSSEDTNGTVDHEITSACRSFRKQRQCHARSARSTRLQTPLLRIHNDLVYISIMSLHNRIAVLRAEKKLSRARLASSVGVNPQTIGFLERAGVHAPQEGGLRCT